MSTVKRDQNSRSGLGLRLWFALLGINREVEKSLQGGLHRIRKQWWGWVGSQHKSVRFGAYAIRVLLREVGAMAWDVQHGVHIGTRAGWHEGAHRHAERRELSRLRNKHGEGYKDHPEYQTAVGRIKGERQARNTEYAIYSTKYRLAAHKGERLPKVSDHVPAPSPPPVVIDTTQPQPAPAQAPTASLNLNAPVVAFEPKRHDSAAAQNPPTAPDATISNGGNPTMGAVDLESGTIPALERNYDEAQQILLGEAEQQDSNAKEAGGRAEEQTSKAQTLKEEAAALEELAASMGGAGHDHDTVADLSRTAEAYRAAAEKADRAAEAWQTAAMLSGDCAATDTDVAGLCATNRQALTSRTSSAREGANALRGATVGVDAYRDQ